MSVLDVFSTPKAATVWALPLLLVASAAVADLPPDLDQWSIERLDVSVPAVAAGMSAANLVLDDGTREANIGFGDVAASQFLWFNRFAPPFPFGDAVLEEIQVLFPPSSAYDVGDTVQLVVYRDADQDPTNGADLLVAFDDVIQVTDGATFSVFPLVPPLDIAGGSDILIGVVNRFVDSGVSPPSRPAALDTSSSSQMRSYFAIWAGDPPAMPDLPGSVITGTIDTIQPGNWMIRGVATIAPPPIEIPVFGGVGATLLALTLGLLGILVMRRSAG